MIDRPPPFWPTLAPGPDVHRSWLEWLVRLRWVAVFAQVIVLSMSVSLLHTAWVLVPLIGVTAILLAGNLQATRVLQDPEAVVTDRELGAQLSMEVLALTCFFLFAGGSGNPFVALFLIHIAMGAIMLRPPHATALTIGILGAYGLVTWLYYPLHYDRHALAEPVVVGIGHGVAFALTAASVTVFVLGLSSTLRVRNEQLLDAHDRAAATDRLRTVGTLAAGAAHELNTPLSTIRLRLGRIGRRHEDDDTARDLAAARGQLDRCSDIVTRLLATAGDPAGSEVDRVCLAEVVAETVRLWEVASSVPVAIEDESDGVFIEVPVAAFGQALTALLQNALEAQEEVGCAEAITVRLTTEGPSALMQVVDRGSGLPSAVERVGEPFFTTKPAGTGLGVFVARAVATGVGGGLGYSAGQGSTIATWWCPAHWRTL